MLPGWLSTLTALARGKAPCAGAPVRSAIWPHTMLTEIPVRKPIITEYETNRVYRPRRDDPGGCQRNADQDHQQRDCLGPLGCGHALQRRARRQGGGRRRRDHHQPGIRAESASDRPGEARVQALYGIDAGQDRGRHPVRHAADRARQPGQKVGAQVPPFRPDRVQPVAGGGYSGANCVRHPCAPYGRATPDHRRWPADVPKHDLRPWLSLRHPGRVVLASAGDSRVVGKDLRIGARTACPRRGPCPGPPRKAPEQGQSRHGTRQRTGNRVRPGT